MSKLSKLFELCCLLLLHVGGSDSISYLRFHAAFSSEVPTHFRWCLLFEDTNKPRAYPSAHLISHSSFNPPFSCVHSPGSGVGVRLPSESSQPCVAESDKRSVNLKLILGPIIFMNWWYSCGVMYRWNVLCTF